MAEIVHVTVIAEAPMEKVDAAVKPVAAARVADAAVKVVAGEKLVAVARVADAAVKVVEDLGLRR